MYSLRINRKLSAKIQKLSTIFPRYLEFNKLFEQKDRTNWSIVESYQGKNKSHPFKVKYTVDFLLSADAGFLSDGLQVPSYGIISESVRMKYASLL
ncbi:hypothetical protein H5410_015294 [Solanum commersonii]|uniref:Uncharacterized protein n=1 Tax=Solanum commersonii TaxID=4109 RepID=A0A9J5ZTA4_SOLCO|nr:hypothetical protein H5410_015294 [Solanum commersonii]